MISGFIMVRLEDLVSSVMAPLITEPLNLCYIACHDSFSSAAAINSDSA